MRKGKIAVIGGSGFIGTELVRSLVREKRDVVIVDKKTSDQFPDLWKNADVRDEKSLLKALKGCSVIYNLAAEHKDNVQPPDLYDDVNITGARNVCTAAEVAGIKTIIFTSTVAVYGFVERETDENGEINYFNDYGRTKYEAEKVYKNWFKRGKDRKLVIIRPTVVFGEKNRGNVYNLFRQVTSGKFLMIGSGRNKKSMAYVENVAGFLSHVLSLENGEHLFNYIDKPDFDMNTLVRTIKTKLGKGCKRVFHFPYFLGYLGGIFFDLLSALSGKEFSVSRVRVKKFCSNTIFYSSKIGATGFKPKVSLEEGINRTIESEFMNQ